MNASIVAAIVQIVCTAILAALAAYVAIKVALTEVRANQLSMNSRMDRIEDKLDRLTERRS